MEELERKDAESCLEQNSSLKKIQREKNWKMQLTTKRTNIDLREEDLEACFQRGVSEGTERPISHLSNHGGSSATEDQRPRSRPNVLVKSR
jgi:hypothetical protein